MPGGRGHHLGLFFFNIYLFIWPHWVLVLAHGVFSCGTWDLVPWPGIEARTPAMGAGSLSHWTTREVPGPLNCRVCVLSWMALVKAECPQHFTVGLRPWWQTWSLSHAFLWSTMGCRKGWEKERISGEKNHCNQGHGLHFLAPSMISSINSILFHYLLI